VKSGRRTLIIYESIKRRIAALPPAKIKPPRPRARRMPWAARAPHRLHEGVWSMTQQSSALPKPAMAPPKGSVIYAPAGQAGEYAEFATNPYEGCGHQCLYCWVPLLLHIVRKKFDAGAVARKDYFARLRVDARKCQAKGITGQVLLSFTTDVYNPFDTSLTRLTIEILIEHGFAFCVLTKGGTRALVDIDLPVHSEPETSFRRHDDGPICETLFRSCGYLDGIRIWDVDGKRISR
jgi:hypothetical protein